MKKTVNALTHVEIDSGIDPEVRAFFEDIGALRQAGISRALSELMWIKHARAVKSSKAYRKVGMTWDQVCDELWNLTADTVNARLKEFEEHGPVFVELKEMLGISGELYRRLGPVGKTDDGKFVIDGRAIDAKNRDAIHAAIQMQIKRTRDAEAAASDAKADAAAARTERDNAKNAAAKLREDHRKYVDDAKLALLNKNERIDNIDSECKVIVGKIRKLLGETLNEAEQDRFVALCESHWGEFGQIAQRVRNRYAPGLESEDE